MSLIAQYIKNSLKSHDKIKKVYSPKLILHEKKYSMSSQYIFSLKSYWLIDKFNLIMFLLVKVD